MNIELITQSDEMVIRRMKLDPGEAMWWHIDTCHRFTVVISGSVLAIEYRDTGERIEFEVATGTAEWDQPETRIHRAINVGETVYEEVVTFFRAAAEVDPQPEYDD